ncbi:hypothetical protein BpHYR1_003305 [Brachionus plicatilis]|uniref:Homeodomain-like DNA binding domain-containing transcription factor n=1 Tax=Brachionus plicatilis TaxID=10195 RepID=A0A3M7SUR3_BRAPC|nr:hypothetical protein BpHYR1_003305 [Brachionus plicatilis]
MIKLPLKNKNKSRCKSLEIRLSGVSPKCVSSTKKRYEETGTVSDRSRSGRPRKLTLRDENYIFREIRNDPTSSYQKLATDFNSKTQAVRISNRDL